LRGLAAIHAGGQPALREVVGTDFRQQPDDFSDYVGVSGICNLIGAIKTARLLGLGKGDNIVTVATDRYDRYPSVLAELEARDGALTNDRLSSWSDRIFGNATTSDILDVRGSEAKKRLFDLKAMTWSRFGYDEEFFRAMKSPSFWQAQVDQIPEIDRKIAGLRDSF